MASGVIRGPVLPQAWMVDCLGSWQVGEVILTGIWRRRPGTERREGTGASHRLLERPLPTSRFSQMVQDKPLRTSWQRKMKDRQERKLAKDFARHLEEEKERRRQVRGRPGRG